MKDSVAEAREAPSAAAREAEQQRLIAEYLAGIRTPAPVRPADPARVRIVKVRRRPVRVVTMSIEVGGPHWSSR